MFNKRIEKFIKNISDNEGYLITDPKNCYYFSGINSSNITLYITKNKRYLITDFRYKEVASENNAGFLVLSEKNTISYLNEIIEEKIIYTELHYVSYDYYLKLKESLNCDILPLGNKIDCLRAIKDETETLYIKKSQEIADKAFLETLKTIKEGISEKDLRAELEYQMAKQGSEKPSFDTIVLFSNHTSLPHGEPGDRKLKNKDIILIDFGATYNGYCSDNTRTFFFGKPTLEMEKAYKTVLSAHIKARDLIKIGMTGKDADKIARDFLDNMGYKNLFGHSLGHGVGLDIHENVRLSPNSDDILKENMIFSIEPGIYMEKNFGIRIEDIYILKNDGVKSLTTLTKELLIL